MHFVWRLSLDTTSMRFICISNFILWIWDISFIHSYWWILGLFSVFDYCKESSYGHSYIMYVFPLPAPRMYITRCNMELLSYRVGKSLVLKETTNNFSKWLYQFTLPLSPRVPIIPPLCQPTYLTFVSSFNLSLLGWECNGIWLHCILHFSDDYGCWEPFQRHWPFMWRIFSTSLPIFKDQLMSFILFEIYHFCLWLDEEEFFFFFFLKRNS